MTSMEDENTRITIQGQAAVTDRTCGQCGLSVPLTVNICPNDGTPLTEVLTPGARLLGRYEFLSVLGEGGMSVVYKARNPDLNKIVAIKMMQAHLIGPQAAGRFRQEAQASSVLNHRNVIRIYDFGSTPEGQPFMVMEYLDGIDLARQIRQVGVLSAEKAVELFLQVCDGLSHAHKHGVLHRDLKPSNIVLCKDEAGELESKIVDFGIAKIVSEVGDGDRGLTRTGEVLGSPPYMSPEQCKGMPLDARSDIYSLGCLMFETLAGKPPFAGGNFMETMFKHLEEEPPTLKQVNPDGSYPASLQALISKCLAKSRADRYQTIDALRADLVEVAQDLTHPRRRRFRVNKRLLVGVICGVMGVSATAGGVWYYFDRQAHQAAIDVKPLDPELTRQAQKSLSWQVMEDLLRQQPHLEDVRISDDIALQQALRFPKLKSLDGQASAVSDRGLKALGASKVPLKGLNLNGCRRITDEGIHYLAKVPLTSLQIQFTPVGDDAMATVGQLKGLKNLGLSRLAITDVGIARLGDLTELEDLDITACQLTDEGLKTVAKMKSLQTLDLEMCQGIHGQGLAYLAPLKNLHSLYMNRTDFQAGSLRFLPTFPLLTYLGLTDTATTDDDLKELGRQPKLENVLLSAAWNITDAGLKNLALCRHLRLIDLRRTQVTADGLMYLKSIPTLSEVDVRECRSINDHELEKVRKAMPRVTFKSDQ